MNQKKTLFFTALCTTFAASLPVMASANTTTLKNRLEPDTNYTIDFDGDGTMETFSYHVTPKEDTETYEYSARIALSVNGRDVYNFNDTDYAYGWTVTQVPMEDGRTLLSLWSDSDNDWTGQSPVLSYEYGSFLILGDFANLSRGDEAAISGWGRLSDVTASGSTIVAHWMDTLYSTGILEIPLSYEIIDDTLTPIDEPAVLTSKQWTVAYPFPVVSEIGKTTPAFTAESGDVFTIDQFAFQDGTRYLHVVRSDSTQGWFADPAQYIFSDNSAGGYFKESVFAG